MIGVCHCGCALETHFKELDTGKRGRCLKCYGDDCLIYRDSEKPNPDNVRPRIVIDPEPVTPKWPYGGF